MQKEKENAVMRVDRFIREHNLLTPNSSGSEIVPATVIVGLSGGPDSVFLLHALHELRSTYNITLIAAHLDHGWRENSTADLLFCKNLADKLGIAFVGAHAGDIKQPVKDSGSREDLGRRLRRTFFADCMQKYNARAVALAHHQDDQIETFMLRLIRGAGTAGLACMRPKHGFYIRPLLEISKEDILAYLREKSITYMLDHTNFTDEHLRNRIRKYVIPAFNSVDARFAASCVRTIKNMQETEAFLEKTTRSIFDDLAEVREKGTGESGGNYCMNLAKFRALDPFMRKRILLHLLCCEKVLFTPSEKFFSEILQFLCRTNGGTHDIHPSWSIAKKQNSFYITKK